MSTSPEQKPRVALTFDDAVANQATVIAPLLAEYGFGATFYISEFKGEGSDCFELDKKQYMDWRQIAKLHELGFEIGNHTLHHPNLTRLDPQSVREEIDVIEQRCAEHGIPCPVTFAWPGGHESVVAYEHLKQKGYWCIRGAGNRPYRAAEDSIWSIPSYGIIEENKELFHEALCLAKQGETIIYIFHGVPDINHPWVTTSPETFLGLMDALHESGLQVVSMKDLMEPILHA